MYLAPLKREISDRNVVIQSAMRPGTMSDGMNNDAADDIVSIILGKKVCIKPLDKVIHNRLAKNVD